MDNSIGISDSYYWQTENEILQDYLKATDALVLSREKRTKPWVWCVGKFCKYQGVNLGSGGGIRRSRYIRIALLIVIVPSIIATYVPKLTIPFLAYGKLVRSPLLVPDHQ